VGCFMRVPGNVIAFAFGLITVFCGPCIQIAQAQQPNSTASIDTYASAIAKAREVCKALWSDRAFDPLRSKVPLGEEKPTFSMLKNTEKLKAKDKPLADLAIKAVEKCRSAYAPAFSMLPQATTALIEGIFRKQDALIAQLYNGKITIGDYNVGLDQMLGEFVEVVSGIRSSSQSPTAAAQTPPKIDPQKLPPPQPRTGIALVIGNSTNLPKLSNPNK
jgi:hypothetical protein